MDGDEEDPRSGGVAVCDGVGSEAGAVASGATAPVTSEAEPTETTETAPAEDAETPAVSADAESEDPVGADVAEDVAEVADGDLPADDVSDGAIEAGELDGVVDDTEADHTEVTRTEVDDTIEILDVEIHDDEVDGREVDDTAMAVFDPPEVAWVAAVPAPEPPAEPGPPRHSAYLRRGVVAVVAAGFLTSAVSAFTWIAPSPEAANQRFVAAVQSEGRVVSPGGQQSLLVTAARKICDRKAAAHTSDRDRRATALTREEIGAVGAAFGADTRDFTALALKTYCSR